MSATTPSRGDKIQCVTFLPLLARVNKCILVLVQRKKGKKTTMILSGMYVMKSFTSVKNSPHISRRSETCDRPNHLVTTDDIQGFQL